MKRAKAIVTGWLRALWTEAAGLWRASLGVLRTNRRVFLPLALLVLAGGLLAHGYDYVTDEAVKVLREQSPRAVWTAGRFRNWGRGNDTAAFAAVLLAVAGLRRSRRLARFSCACVLAVLFTGVFINIFRVGTGRPRPRAEMPDRFTGPSLVYRTQSFPSGHTSASYTAAGSLLVTAPPLGVVALLSATGVGVSSVITRSHYLSDVTVGMGVGLWIGVVAGLGARRLTRPPPTG